MNSLQSQAYPLWLTVTSVTLLCLIVSYHWIQSLRARGKHTAIWLIVAVALVQILTMLISVWQAQQLSASGALGKYLAFSQSSFFYHALIRAIVRILSGWGAAVILFWLFSLIFIKRLRGSFLDTNDIIVYTVAVAAVGWPSVLILLLATFVLSLVGLIFLVILRKRTFASRLVITPFIGPAAVGVLIFQDWLLQVSGLWKISF